MIEYLVRNGTQAIPYMIFMVMLMTYLCCLCGKIIEETHYILSVTKEGCETEQTLYCHEECLEKALHDPKNLYLKHL